MMKEMFLDAEIEILVFPESDIVTFSGYTSGDNELPPDIFIP